MPIYKGKVLADPDPDADFPFIAMITDDEGEVVGDFPVRTLADGEAKVAEDSSPTRKPRMPKGPKGQKRPADVIGNAVKVMRIVTCATACFGARLAWEEAYAEPGAGRAPLGVARKPLTKRSVGFAVPRSSA